jgi:Holin of 3TMs, for gene-transfer release
MALDPITAGLDFLGKVLERVVPDAGQRDAAKVKLLELAKSGELAELQAETDIATAQAETNTAEASSPSLFVAGWRPFVGWVCGSAFAWTFVVGPALSWATGRPLPMPDMSALSMVLLGMLGLGGMRTFEKISGIGAGH